MNFIFNFLKGTALGAGAILPGISSGVLCIIFGIYENLLDSILYFFKDTKSNFKFLFPLVLGGFCGVVILGKVLNSLFYAFPLQIKSAFIGLILGTIPSLLKNINLKYKFNFTNIIYLLLTLLLGLITLYYEKNLILNHISDFNAMYLIFCGFVMSIGVIVPGVSGTLILTLLGVYTSYLSAISNLNISFLLPMFFGLTLGSFLWMKVTKLLLTKAYPQTMYSIIGFTLGSLPILIPSLNTNVDFFISILCVLTGFLISFQIKPKCSK